MTAEERGLEMMVIPNKDLPPLAAEYVEYLVKKLGVCGEVVLTALTQYAQEVEGLTCKDPCYQSDAESKQWFKKKKWLWEKRG